MRRLTPFLALILTLAFAGDAAAKEIVAAKVCGPEKCVKTRDRDQLNLFAEGGAPSDPPAHGGAWYSVQVTISTGDGNHDAFAMAVLPRAGLMRSGDPEGGYSWSHLTPESARRYQAIVSSIAPYPASKLGHIAQPKARRAAASATSGGGGGSPWPWIGGAVVLLVAGAAAFAVRRRGLPWARPSEG
jgi:hypothetical protein